MGGSVGIAGSVRQTQSLKTIKFESVNRLKTQHSHLTCCGGWQSCGCYLLVLLLSLLVSFWLFGGFGFFWLFILLLLVLLLLCVFIGCSPHPA